MGGPQERGIRFIIILKGFNLANNPLLMIIEK